VLLSRSNENGAWFSLSSISDKIDSKLTEDIIYLQQNGIAIARGPRLYEIMSSKEDILNNLKAKRAEDILNNLKAKRAIESDTNIVNNNHHKKVKEFISKDKEDLPKEDTEYFSSESYYDLLDLSEYNNTLLEQNKNVIMDSAISCSTITDKMIKPHQEASVNHDYLTQIIDECTIDNGPVVQESGSVIGDESYLHTDKMIKPYQEASVNHDYPTQITDERTIDNRLVVQESDSVIGDESYPQIILDKDKILASLKSPRVQDPISNKKRFISQQDGDLLKKIIDNISIEFYSDLFGKFEGTTLKISHLMNAILDDLLEKHPVSIDLSNKNGKTVSIFSVSRRIDSPLRGHIFFLQEARLVEPGGSGLCKMISSKEVILECLKTKVVRKKVANSKTNTRLYTNCKKFINKDKIDSLIEDIENFSPESYHKLLEQNKDNKNFIKLSALQKKMQEILFIKHQISIYASNENNLYVPIQKIDKKLSTSLYTRISQLTREGYLKKMGTGHYEVIGEKENILKCLSNTRKMFNGSKLYESSTKEIDDKHTTQKFDSSSGLNITYSTSLKQNETSTSLNFGLAKNNHSGHQSPNIDNPRFFKETPKVTRRKDDHVSESNQITPTN
jgi:hypothetical protein